VPTISPGFGIPAVPLAFEHFTLLWTVIVITILVISATLLWLLRSRETRHYQLRCPHHGTSATITVREPRDDAANVTHCSLCHPGDRLECDRRCLHLVA